MSDRWGEIADWRGPTPNQASGHNSRMGVVLHIAEGYFEGTIAWCKNRNSDVSAHFVTSKDGRMAQLVGTDDTSWCQAAGNRDWISIENEGFGGDELTPGQVEKCARVLAWAHLIYGVPLQVSNAVSTPGLGHHSMGGKAWGGHMSCPGAKIIAQKPAIVAAAIAMVGAPVPPPVPVKFPAWPGRYIMRGSTGQDVRVWQAQMRARGWAISVDGAYGPKSYSVCRQFQAEKHIGVDGIVGPQTWNAAWTAPVS